MTAMRDILLELREAGHTFRLDGDMVRVRPPLPPEKREFLRQHKPELVALLKANSGSVATLPLPEPLKIKENASSGNTTPPKTYSRLELATDCLGKLISDEQQRRRIRAIAQTAARGWRFAGTATYQHILAGSILDAVEQDTGKLICFIGSPEPDRFTGWLTKDKT